MAPSLKNPKLKIERAKEHLDVLNAKLIEFQDTNPFKILDFEDPQNAIYIRQLEIPIIDPKLAIITGDAIYSLRSALDHIAWQLALTKTDRPFDRTCFPIVGENTTSNMRNFRATTRDIPIDAITEIVSLQPYTRGSNYKTDPLWMLDKLCNIDKHRVIPAQGTAIDFKIPKGVEVHFGTFNNKQAVFMPIKVKARMKFAPPPTADIVIGSQVDGLSISVKELSKIYEYVRDTVLTRFSRFFPE
jgi:hypothetical protein